MDTISISRQGTPGEAFILTHTPRDGRSKPIQEAITRKQYEGLMAFIEFSDYDEQNKDQCPSLSVGFEVAKWSKSPSLETEVSVTTSAGPSSADTSPTLKKSKLEKPGKPSTRGLGSVKE